MQRTSSRVYVEVNVQFSKDGRMQPRSLTWGNGTVYDIERVTTVRPVKNRKMGTQGDRYTIVVNGVERNLFFERIDEFGKDNVGRWFVQRK